TIAVRKRGVRLSRAEWFGDGHQRLVYVVMAKKTFPGTVPAADPRAAKAADELQSRAPQPPQSLPNSAGLRLLAVHAHPDDEASKGAAMMAAYADAGAEVMVATATGGERGDL